MDQSEVVELLRDLVQRKYGHARNPQTCMANEWGVSAAMVSRVLRGHKPPTNEMLADIGLRKRTVTIYERMPQNAELSGAAAKEEQ